MNGRRTPATGRIARWVLLSCTLFGLAVMHTLGHTGPQAGTHQRLEAAAMAAAGDFAAASAFVPGQCADGHCDGGGHSGWSVCLAILSGLVAVALLVALLSWMTSDRGRRSAKASGQPPAPRGPPHPPAGLTLASVAVLRI